MIKILFLKTNIILIARVDEVSSELGEPDCKLIKPFIVSQNGLIPWMNEFTNQPEIMIHSDSILTIVDPNKEYLDKYQSLTAE